MANIVLNSLTYVGRGVVNAVATWLNTGAGFVRGFRKLSCAIRSDAGSDSLVTWRLELPRLVDPENACCAPAGTRVGRPSTVEVRFRFDEFSSGAERDDALKQLKDLVLTAELSASVISYTLPSP